MKSLNINSKVMIKITKMGESVYNKHYNNLNMVPPKIERDENGYTIFQMWEVFNIFGASLTMVFSVPFETNILINDADIKEQIG